MADYFEAPCLVVLVTELNKAHPNRDKRSDGWIGDAAHAARPSGHNPDWKATGKTRGVVRARDIDKDGPDLERLLALGVKDVRTDYIIWRGQIWSRVRNFRPIKYTGVNGHFEHMHFQIRPGYEFDTRPWGYYTPSAPPKEEPDMNPTQSTQLAHVFKRAEQNNHSLNRIESKILPALQAQIVGLAGALAAVTKGEAFDEAKLLAGVEAAANRGAQEAIDARIKDAEVTLNVDAV